MKRGRRVVNRNLVILKYGININKMACMLAFIVVDMCNSTYAVTVNVKLP